MELKKTPGADLQNKRVIFFEIGLAVSLGLAIVAFNYTSHHKEQPESLGTELAMEDIQMMPPIEFAEPLSLDAPVQMPSAADRMKIVESPPLREQAEALAGSLQTLEVEALRLPSDALQQAKPPPAPEDEGLPHFGGGDLNTFRLWVQSRLIYPVDAAKKFISGSVIVSFFIEKDGTLSSLQVMQSPQKMFSDEVTKVISSAPKWEPGQKNGVPIRVKYILPVQFHIQR